MTINKVIEVITKGKGENCIKHFISDPVRIFVLFHIYKATIEVDGISKVVRCCNTNIVVVNLSFEVDSNVVIIVHGVFSMPV